MTQTPRLPGLPPGLMAVNEIQKISGIFVVLISSPLQEHARQLNHILMMPPTHFN